MVAVFRPAYSVRIWLRAPHPASQAGAQGAPYVLLNSAAQAPFAQRDWPNPSRRLVVAAPGFTNPFPLNLYGQDQFFGAPGQGPRNDLANPVVRRSPPPPAQAINYLLLTTGGATAAPFAPAIFDNPPRRTAMTPDTGALGAPLTVLTALAAAPPVQSLFDNPPRRRPFDYGFASSSNIALFSVVVAAPFYRSDWPNPIRRQFSMALTWVPPLPPSLIPPGTQPIIAYPLTGGAASAGPLGSTSIVANPLAGRSIVI